jgi:membrane-bound ClpP family serine protease
MKRWKQTSSKHSKTKKKGVSSMRKFEVIRGVRSTEKAKFQGETWRVVSARFVDEGRHVHYGIRNRANETRVVRSDKLQRVW